MSQPDFTQRGWFTDHKQCVPEDLLPWIDRLWISKGVEWIEKLGTLEGELELYDQEKMYEAAYCLTLVIRHHGFKFAERYLGTVPSEDELELRKRLAAEKEGREGEEEPLEGRPQ